MTEPEVAEHIQRSDLVLVPTGSLEQHGPHSPLGTDVIISTRGLQASRRGQGWARSRAGVLRSCRSSQRIQGSRIPPPSDLHGSHRGPGQVPRRVGLPPHRVRERPLHELPGDQSRLPQRLAPAPEEDVHAWAVSYWDALPAEQVEAYLSLKAGLHANIGETSAVMAVRPELVKLDRSRRLAAPS